jgi:hypothetical protein
MNCYLLKEEKPLSDDNHAFDSTLLNCRTTGGFPLQVSRLRAIFVSSLSPEFMGLQLE